MLLLPNLLAFHDGSFFDPLGNCYLVALIPHENCDCNHPIHNFLVA